MYDELAFIFIVALYYISYSVFLARDSMVPQDVYCSFIGSRLLETLHPTQIFCEVRANGQ